MTRLYTTDTTFPTTYVAPFEKEISTAPPTDAGLTHAAVVPAQSLTYRTHFYFSPESVHGQLVWPETGWTMSAEVTQAGADMTYWMQVSRLKWTDLSQLWYVSSGALTGTGVKVYSPPLFEANRFGAPSEDARDRLWLSLYADNANMMTDQVLAVTYSDSQTFVDNPNLGGSPTQNESGGAAAPVSVAAVGAGSAVEAAAGGANAPVSVAPDGAGTALEAAAGGADAPVSVAATGDGTSQGAQSGGADAPVAITATGAGVATEAAAGGADAPVTVVASGAGAGVESAASGSDAPVVVTADGAGSARELGAGGADAPVSVAPTGAGAATEAVDGGANAPVTVNATGEGTATEASPTSGGASAPIEVAATGGGVGVEFASSGADAWVYVTAGGDGVAITPDGDVVFMVGAPMMNALTILAPTPDVDISVGDPTVHAFAVQESGGSLVAVGAATGHAFDVADPSGHPLTTDNDPRR